MSLLSSLIEHLDINIHRTAARLDILLRTLLQWAQL